MVKKILNVFSLIVVFLFILAVYGWMVNQIGKGSKKFGVLTEPIKFMYSFPDLFKTSVKEVNALPKTFIPTPKGFQTINKLNKDVIVLSSYSTNDSTREIAIKNLKDDSILKKWEIKNRHSNIARIFHPLLLDDTSVVHGFGYTWDGIERIDKNGKVLWKQNDVLFHHAMELAHDGHIWACTKEKAPFINAVMDVANKQRYYMDYSITKVDRETGKIRFNKSISAIMKANNLENYFFKSHALKDPLHLNDVQPALKTTKYYDKDDVFLSLRTISCILHYRPSTNEVIRVIEGPFVSQHDVDIYNDSSLFIFNNNFYAGSYRGTHQKPNNKKQKLFNLGEFSSSSIVKLDLSTNEFSVVGDSIFRANKIMTDSEGLQEFLNDSTYFVEEQNSGLLWIIQGKQVVYKNVFRSQHKNHHHLPNWTRIIEHDYN